jgi:hypothetical protein
MGEVSQCPRELSSRATETEVVGDAGPVYNRVKPADYGLWDTLMTRLAADFAGEIDVWEIWNEANLGNVYWTGTVEDFAELVQHTSRALRRGNPQTKIAAAGFVGGHDFADRLLQLGMGRELDILSVHYTDLNPEHLPAWQALLDKHDLKLPLWNTEERSEVPLQNLAGPIERSFKFCHLNVGYEDYRPLVNLDLTPRPSAVWYAVGAHCLGTAKYVGTGEAPAGLTLRLFARGEERIGALTPEVRTGELLTEASRAIIAAEPLRRGAPVEATDSWGKTTQLRLRDGQATVPLRRMLFITGARRVRVVSLDTGRPASVVIAEAESGRHAPGWYVGTHDGFSQGKTVDVWSDADPGPEGYWITVPFSVPVAGAYDVLFAGNSLARLSTPRSLSPFVWQIDGGPEQTVAAAVPVTADVAGAPEGLSALGNVRLAAGDHVFHLRLTARREVPDQRWALWFDALALRRTIDE